MYPFTVRTSLDLFIYLEEVPGSVDMPLCESEDIWFVLTRGSGLHREEKLRSAVIFYIPVTYQTYEESSPTLLGG